MWALVAAAAVVVALIWLAVARLLFPVEHAHITSYSIHPDGTIRVGWMGAERCREPISATAHVTDAGVIVDVTYRGLRPGEAVADVGVECSALLTPDAPLEDGPVMGFDGSVITTVTPY